MAMDRLVPNAGKAVQRLTTGATYVEQVDSAGNPVSAGGGPATIADGADVAQGATTDGSAASDTGNATLISLIKRLLTKYSNLNVRVQDNSGTGVQSNSNNNDAQGGMNSLSILGFQFQYIGANTWDRVRTAKIHKPQSAVSIASEATVWTPGASKKFRLMGGIIACSVDGNVTFKDNTAGTTIAVVPVKAGEPVSFNLLNGIVSAVANNVLTATGPAASTLSGTLFGTEE